MQSITKETILIFLLTIAIFVVGIFVVDLKQADADSNNGDSKKSCNDHQDSASSQCSNKDPTPLILPFP
jgi:hypothetical protein